MKVQTRRISVTAQGSTDIIDLTPPLQQLLTETGLTEGQVTVFAPGATAGISTIEYEPGLLQDIPELFDRLIPADHPYHHDQTWHDGNGHSHCRATLLGPSMTIPFEHRTLILGTWQQVILIDFDNRARQRSIVAQFIGE
jgi:secondary thiamine-phosphate synthase enzyme